MLSTRTSQSASGAISNLPIELLLDILEVLVQDEQLETTQHSTAQRWVLSSTCAGVWGVRHQVSALHCIAYTFTPQRVSISFVKTFSEFIFGVCHAMGLAPEIKFTGMQTFAHAL